MNTIKVFGLTSYGLEAISAAEMAAVDGLTLTETTYRRLSAQCAEASLPALLDLRTLDDIYLEVATWKNIKHTRDALTLLEDNVGHLDLKPSANICATTRPIPNRPTFSVTASFVGKRNYDTDEIKAAVASGVTAHHDWRYTLDDREADLNVRLFIVHELTIVGLRLGKHALHERDYEKIQRPGALKPSVAAAMLKLAHIEPGMSLLDPCCGTGTILIEGAQLGAIVRGGDIESEAISAARTNSLAIGVNLSIEEWDARALPIPDHSVDRIVTNLPWGRQIKVDDELALFYRDVCAEMERVLAAEGRLAVLTSLPHLLYFERLQPDHEIHISLFGQRPTIVIFSG